MKDRINNLNHKYIKLKEIEVRAAGGQVIGKVNKIGK